MRISHDDWIGGADVDALLTTRQVAALLGVSEGTVFNWRRSAGLPYMKIGNSVRFSKKQVLAWAAAHMTGWRAAEGEAR